MEWMEEMEWIHVRLALRCLTIDICLGAGPAVSPKAMSHTLLSLDAEVARPTPPSVGEGEVGGEVLREHGHKCLSLSSGRVCDWGSRRRDIRVPSRLKTDA